MAEGPDPLLTWLEATIEELLGEAGRDPASSAASASACRGPSSTSPAER